jgi:hypothetical protein
MTIRGAREAEATMIASAFRGDVQRPAARAQSFALVRGG